VERVVLFALVVDADGDTRHPVTFRHLGQRRL
jgi:hypothetical protein